MLKVTEDEPWVVNSITDETGRCVHLDGNWTALTGQTQEARPWVTDGSTRFIRTTALRTIERLDARR